MQTVTQAQPAQYERAVIALMRRLPVEKQAEVLDFANYLAERGGRLSELSVAEREAHWRRLDALIAKAHANSAGYSSDAIEDEITAVSTEAKTAH